MTMCSSLHNIHNIRFSSRFFAPDSKEVLKFICGAIGCTILSLFIFVPLFTKILLSLPPSITAGDYLGHIEYTTHIFDSPLNSCHVLFHLCILLVQKILSCIDINIDLRVSTIIVMVSCETLSCLFLYCFLYASYRSFSILLYSVCLTVIAPIYILHKIDGFYLLGGYLHPNTIHNPTIITLKPLMLLLFILTPKFLFYRTENILLKYFFLILIILSSLAKPSYIIIMLPSFIILYFIYSNRINTSNLLSSGGLCFIMLVGMYIFTYLSHTSTSSSGVLFVPTTPFLVVYKATPNFFLIFCKQICSILFPIYVLFTCSQECRKDFYFIYSLILMFFAMFFYAFFVESGPRMLHGNFMWSALAANLLLFVSSFRIFISKYNTSQLIIAKLGYFIFAIHTLCGVYYYFRIFQGRVFF